MHSVGDRAYLESHPELVDYVWRYVGEALARSTRGPSDEVKAYRQARNYTADDMRTPVLVWHGAEDVLAPLSEILAYLGGKAREVRVIEGIGHLMCAKHWDEIMVRMAGEAPAA
jgi:pimeloyl-ACP methyl ester carboxylesterase